MDCEATIEEYDLPKRYYTWELRPIGADFKVVSSRGTTERYEAIGTMLATAKTLGLRVVRGNTLADRSE